jgi:acyl-CoA hydrolase
VRLVLCAEGPVEPQAALEAYFQDHPPTAADPVHLLFGMRRSTPSLPAASPKALTIGSFLPGRGLRHVDPLTYHRMSYSEICHALTTGALVPHAIIAAVTTPLPDGARSLGGVNGYLDLAVAGAPLIYAEEVAWLPHIAGATRLERADRIVSSRTTDQAEQPRFAVPFDDVDSAIASRVADLIPLSPHLALGIGRVSDALTGQLKGRGDISLLTGVIADSTRTLHESGALTEGPMRSMSVIGSPSLLRWAAAADVEIRPSTQIHEPSWLASHERFVAVLGALQVDEQGNVNSETIGGRTVSGRGGAPDFARGAHDSPGGLSILALPSTDRSGESRLVPRLSDPSMSGDIIDVVVTEKGVADLRDLDRRSRRRAIQSVF